MQLCGSLLRAWQSAMATEAAKFFACPSNTPGCLLTYHRLLESWATHTPKSANAGDAASKTMDAETTTRPERTYFMLLSAFGVRACAGRSSVGFRVSRSLTMRHERRHPDPSCLLTLQKMILQLCGCLLLSWQSALASALAITLA